MLRFTQKVLFAVLLAVIAGCSGGGCSSGCSCGGVTPLAAGFPQERRIENVGAARLTDSGLDFLEANAGALAGLLLGGEGGIFTFEIPSISDGVGLGTSYSVCPDGAKPMGNPPECIVEFDLLNTPFQVDAQGPHNIHVHGPLHIRIQKLPVDYSVVWVPGSADVTFNGNGACPGGGQPFAAVDLSVNISLEIDSDPGHARFGYTRIRMASITIDEDQVLDQIEYCDAGIGGVIVDAVDGFLYDFVEDALVEAVTNAVEDAMCQQADPNLNPPCPLGTTNVDGVCRYGTDENAECASIILGTEGNFDLGGLLAGFSPGTKGAFNFLFAAGGDSVRPDGTGHHYGDLNPINGGATLSLYGGTDPTPVSGCVTPVDIELPSGIPVPDELTANTVANWPADVPGPHFGVAVSERFTNYMLTQLYNSGALCLGVTADAIGPSVPLTTSVVGLGVGAKSLSELGRMGDAAPLALIIRPGQPPHAEFGKGTDPETDPLIRVTMNQVSIDFYAWSLDRYIRAMTMTMDLDVPANLEVGPDGLTPVIKNINVANATVTNHEKLIREDPAKIAAAVQDLLGSLVGGALGDALPAIDLSSMTESLGLALVIPPTVEGQGSPGLTKLTKESDDFLGIFASLELAMQMNLVAPETSKTEASLRSFDVDPEGLYLASRTEHNGPRAVIDLGSSLDDGTRTIEWQYRLNNGVWKPFTRARYLVIDDGVLRFQGKHKVYVRSRVAGRPMTLDPEPVEIDLIVDDAAPEVKVVELPTGEIVIRADDAVSGGAGTRVRFRFMRDGIWDTWSEWLSASAIPALVDAHAEEIEVEAQDEDGHIATVQHAIIRGRAAAAGCECTLGPASPAAPANPGGWLLMALAGLALVRRRFVEGLGTLAGKRVRANAKRWLGALGLVTLGGVSGCSCGDQVNTAATTCRERGNCQVLLPGLIGAYTSVAVAPDGRVWVAGYLEKDWENDWEYGDLVVGPWVDGQMAWKIVDGVPNDPVDENVYDPKGFRGGQTDEGDDVGLWTSIAIAPNGQPAVAYFDATNLALKYASFDGSAWATTTVQQVPNGDVGRYGKLLFVNGAPTIAYLFIEPGEMGAVNSGVRLAVGSAADAGGASWTFEDVYRDLATPCRTDLCPSGTECVLETGLCADRSSDCAEDCGDGICVVEGGAPVCRTEGLALSTYPDAAGLYVDADLRPDGSLGLAWYDRIHGNVMAAQRDPMAGWLPVIVDGQDAAGTDTGDKGIGLSLDIDATGNFHLAYVDGLSESLNYALVEGGATVVAIEVVDDGLGAGDGTHIVGDDSDIVVTASGEIHVSYQDATTGTLQYAVGTPSAAGHEWKVRAVTQDEFAGFFSEIVTIGGAQQVVNWWRVGSPSAKGGVRILTP